jgi:hypothetical protein
MASELASALRDAIQPALDELTSRLVREFSRLDSPNSLLTDRLLLTPSEAAEALGISAGSLGNLDIPRVVLGPRLIRYSVDDLRTAIREHQIPTDPTKEA